MAESFHYRGNFWCFARNEWKGGDVARRLFVQGAVMVMISDRGSLRAICQGVSINFSVLDDDLPSLFTSAKKMKAMGKLVGDSISRERIVKQPFL